MKQRILIADDSLTVRMDLKESFEDAGFEVALAGSLAAARAEVDRRAPAAIVLDVQFPDGSGLDLLEELKAGERTAALPVVLLSTRAEVAERIAGLAAGADDYAGKPYESDFLISRVCELVKASDAASAAGAVLLIEDSLTFRKELRGALEDAGYRVLEADSGLAGLRLAARMRPAAIIVDGDLPELDGPQVIQRMRLDPTLRSTPCLLLTASASRDQELLALAAGADAYLLKGQGLDVTISRLRGLLGQARAEVSRNPDSLFGPKRLLAVDDSETFLQELAGALRPDGYELALARSGEEALELLEVQSVDCILLDLVMPGLSGQEVCRRIKERSSLRDIPVLLLTAREDAETMIEGFSVGADDYIAKSADFEVLRARIQSQLRRRHFESENQRIRHELYRREVEAAQERAAREAAELRAMLVTELEAKVGELEDFAYATSHDLQSPLRTVARFSELLEEDLGPRLEAEERQYLDFIVDGVGRMQDMIEALLSYARLSTNEFPLEACELERELDGALEVLRVELEDSGATVERPPLPRVMGFPMQLSRVFQNIIGNAIKYRREAPEIKISCERRADDWLLGIADNGIGFDPSQAERIFRIFRRLVRQSEFSGTGIGLAIVRKIVERHGGRIWAESMPEVGSTFWFTLPTHRGGDEARCSPAARFPARDDDSGEVTHDP